MIDVSAERSPAPASPRSVLGVHYDTDWTRRLLPTVLRNVTYALVVGPISRFICRPAVVDVAHVQAGGPVIIAPNHVSHFDTLAALCALPARVRRRTVVAAAVDNFYDTRWKCVLYSLFLQTIPVERTRVNRASGDVAARLIGEGYNLLIFPEGGRSFTDEMLPFRGGAAYLAKRCGVPVVPVYLKGVRAILPKGSSRVRRGHIEVRFGPPLTPLASTDRGRPEDARRFTTRIQDAVVALGAIAPPVGAEE